jgi:spore germination cell wall hydrolase CwlJ-like protein
MDSLAPFADAPISPSEGGERGRQHAERLFGRSDDQPSSEYLVQQRRLATRPRSARRRRPPPVVATMLGLGGGAALLLFGFAVETGRNGQPSVTRALPAATPPGATIINLPPPNLVRALSPEEATKENAERPFVARPDTPAARFVLQTDADGHSRALTCLAQAVYYEAAGEGTDGGRAVAQVVLNRLHHPGYPSTICGVVYEGADRPSGCQFSFTCDGSMQRIPISSLWARSREIAEQALAGKVFAPIGHATHYHADYVLPFWADSLDKSVQVGRHIFYRLPSVFGEARAFSQRYAGSEPAVREPGATLALPATGATEQLATALIGDGLQGTAGEIEKASPQPGSPLVADSAGGTLLADSGSAPSQSHKPKSSAQCPTAADHKQLVPLGADDMRTSAGGPNC